MALFVKATSKPEFGSEVLGFTSNTRDMTLPGHVGVTFKASPGITPTIIENNLDEAANLEMTGVYNADSFTQTEVLAGKWNFAAIEVFMACWDNTDLGELLVFSGNLGDFRDYQTYFTCEGRGKIARLSQDVQKVVSRLCRVKEFGDEECKVDLEGTVEIETVEYNITEEDIELDGSYAQSDTFIAVLTSSFAGNVPPENFYANGKMTAVGGPNDGVSREIAYNTAESGSGISIQLKRPFPFVLSDAVGTVTLIAGCDRTIENCMRYNNIVNRRAEDWVTNLEELTRLPQS